MSVGQEPEVLVDLIIAELRAKMDQALSDMRTDRDDPRISTTKPVSYYVSESFDALQTPAIYVIADEVDYRNVEMKANYIAGKMLTNISIIVEDQDTEILTRRCFRYVAAIREIIHLDNLTSSNNAAKIVVVVERIKFSRLYTKAQQKGETSGVFRKEAVLYCSVHITENL